MCCKETGCGRLLSDSREHERNSTPHGSDTALSPPSLNHKSYSEGLAAGERLYLDPGCWWVFCSFQGKLLKVSLSWHSKGKRSLFKEKRLFQKETWKEHKISDLPQSWRRRGKECCGGQCEVKLSICRDQEWAPRALPGPHVCTTRSEGGPECESSHCCCLAVAQSEFLRLSISGVRSLWLTE